MIGYVGHVSALSYDILEKCLKDIFSVIKPVEDDQNKRLFMIQELANSIHSVAIMQGAAVKPFGSFVSNLYSKSGDLDISIELRNGSNFLVSKKKKQNALRELRRALQIRGVAGYIQFIPNARVPVLQYVSNHFGISCDISINNYPGRIKSKIFYWINCLDDRFGDMVLLIKEWAKAQNINDPKTGTLNSYSLCLLVIFHFQTCEPAILPPLKEIYEGNIEEDITETVFYNEKHLDEVCAANIARFQRQNLGKRNQSPLCHLLTSFFCKFLQINTLSSRHAICTYTGRLEHIQNNPSWMTKSYSLLVEDPFERPDNAARAVGVKELGRIARAFNDASGKLYSHELMDRNALLPLLCTPSVCSKLGGHVIATPYRNLPPRSHQHVRPVGHAAAKPYNTQHNHRTRLLTINKPVHNHQQTETTGRQSARPYQNHQWRRQEYMSDHQTTTRPVTTRFEPVLGRSHNGPTWDSGSPASSSSPQTVRHGNGNHHSINRSRQMAPG